MTKLERKVDTTTKADVVQLQNRQPDPRPGGDGNGNLKVYGGYTVGGEDVRGQTITAMYFGAESYVVYKTDEGLHWDYDPKAVDKANLAVLASANYRLGGLMASLPDKGKAMTINIARAAHLTLMGCAEDAKQILGYLEKKVQKQRKTWGQLRYLGAAAFPVGFLVLASIIFALDGEPLLAGRIESLLYIVTAGSLAGFLSVLTKLRQLDIDIDQPWKVDAYYGLSRIAIAAIASVLAYILMKAGVFFGTLEDSTNSTAGILTVAILAGFTENLVPDLLRNAADQEAKGNHAGGAGGPGVNQNPVTPPTVPPAR